MNTAHNAKLKVFRTAHAVLDEKKAALQKSARLLKLLADLHAEVRRLDALNVEQKVPVEEATITQNLRRAEMADLAQQVSAVIVVDAQLKRNGGLVSRARAKREALVRESFAEAVAEAERILALAGDHAEAFAESEVEPGLVLELENAIKAFRAVQGTPRNLTSLRAGTTAEFDRGIRKGQLLLTQIDKLMLQFIKKDPPLWKTWKSARKGKVPAPTQTTDTPAVPAVSPVSPAEVSRSAGPEKPEERAA